MRPASMKKVIEKMKGKKTQEKRTGIEKGQKQKTTRKKRRKQTRALKNKEHKRNGEKNFMTANSARISWVKTPRSSCLCSSINLGGISSRPRKVKSGFS